MNYDEIESPGLLDGFPFEDEEFIESNNISIVQDLEESILFDLTSSFDGVSQDDEDDDEYPCRSEALPFIKLDRPKGHQKETNPISHENSRRRRNESKLYESLREEITIRVQEECLGKFYSNHISELLTWLDAVSPWEEIMSSDGESCMAYLQFELKLLLLEIIGKTIISDLFPIIIEFPDSRPILDDLKYCLRKVPLRQSLVSSLKSSLEKRLLNPGVNTSDLLDAYVSTVRALKYVDPSGILIQLVSPPIRDYLKRREETVRVILVSLTEETGELAEELARNPSNSQEDLPYWDEWKPDPIDVPRDQQNLRKLDLIQTILSIYGSKSLFMDEYRALLADRLLKMPKPKPITHEIKCLELLKLRFGDADLQKCEVMLKDVADSHRLNVRFHEEEGAVLAHQEIPVTGLVISAQFWPTLKQESLTLPNQIETLLSVYTKAFEMIKGNRSLEWQRHIGYVQFELDLNGATVNFSVSPVLATILWHFQEKDDWSLEELSNVTGLSESVVKARMSFWISKGIIVEEGVESYHLSDTFPNDGASGSGLCELRHVEEEMDSHMTSASAQREAELQMFWTYIEGMLANLEFLPLSRIYSMLKLFATVECSLEEVQKFLDQKVGLGVLLYSNGNYKVPK